MAKVSFIVTIKIIKIKICFEEYKNNYAECFGKTINVDTYVYNSGNVIVGNSNDDFCYDGSLRYNSCVSIR